MYMYWQTYDIDIHPYMHNIQARIQNIFPGGGVPRIPNWILKTNEIYREEIRRVQWLLSHEEIIMSYVIAIFLSFYLFFYISLENFHPLVDWTIAN